MKTKQQKTRNPYQASAQFRKAGAHKTIRKQLDRKRKHRGQLHD
jgi:hypothetical protein